MNCARILANNYLSSITRGAFNNNLTMITIHNNKYVYSTLKNSLIKSYKMIDSIIDFIAMVKPS